MWTSTWLPGSSLLALAACAASGTDVGVPFASIGDHRASARPLPALADAVHVWDSHAQRALELEALLDRLAGNDVVFLGETHLDDTTHRVEAAVLAGLLERRGGEVVLSLEMFERDVQPALDDYLAGRTDERTFLAAARPWGNYATDYRPLIELAKAHGIPVVAANAPAALRRKVSAGKRAALDALAPAERSLFPAEIRPATSAYWERVDRATRGHMNFASLPDEERLWSGQNLWDNSMGDACARALAAHPGSTVLHVVGGFHVMYGDGTVAQFRARAPDASVAVVEVMPVLGAFAARPARDEARADYLVYADALARSVSDGTHAVLVPGELRYTLDLPASASAQSPAPLLLWLPDGDERPADVRAWLRAALGDEVALAVVEPPYAERAADLAPGGRWSQVGSTSADLGRVQHGLERVVEHVTRRLPVSSERVLVGGSGLGATAVLWSATYTEWLAADFLAVRPRGAGALRMEGLPDYAPVTRTLRVLAAAGGASSLEWLANDFRTLGTPVELAELGAGTPSAEALEAELRARLGLAPRARPAGDELLLVLERELPRARAWAEVHARRLERAGERVRVVTAAELTGREAPARLRRLALGGEWPLAGFAAGSGIPLAPGDFGGTTVLVVPAGVPQTEREAWFELERNKALAKRSPFAGLRVAVAEGEPSLATVLTELKDARSVLVVPATFCASPAEMRALEAGVPAAAAELDLVWLPGLGGELCTAEEE
jgi:uncharacterized iron-regulated protein